MTTALDESESARSDQHDRETPSRRIAALLAVFLTPTLAVVASGTQLSWLDNTIDPFIYVGTTERLGDYLTRWPETYFPYRFGYILPEQLSGVLFGDLGGYLVLRAVLLGAIGLLVWPRRVGSQVTLVPAVLGAAVFALSPMVQRALFTTYTPTGMAFFVLALALVVPTQGSRDPRCWLFICSGATAALAWNSHPTVLPLLVVCIAVLLLDQLIEGRFSNFWGTVGRGMAWVAGMVATIGVAWVYLGVRYSAWELYGSAMNQASKDTESVFLEQTATWFTWRHYLLAVPLALLAGLIAHQSSRDDRARRSLRRLMLVTATAFVTFAAFQWLLATPLLSIYYYSSIPLGLAVFLLARSVACMVWAQAPRRHLVYSAAALSVLVGGLLLGRWVKPSYTVIILAIAVLVVVGIAAARTVGSVLSLRHLRFATCALLTVTFAAGYVSTSSPHDFPPSNPGFRIDPLYDTAMFTYDQSVLPVYEVAHEYAEFVPDLADEPGNLRVWFRSVDSGYTNQAQATLVHGMSALQPFPDGGLPDLGPFEIARIQEEDLTYVIVVDSDPAVVRMGVDRLREAGVGLSEKRTATFSEGTVDITVTVMERTPTG